MLPLSERVKNVFDALGTTIHKFSKQHEFSRTSLFNVVSGRNQPVFNLVERLCVAEPRISAEYLLRGEGEPLRDEQLATALSTVEELRAFKEQMDTAIEKRIQELNATSGNRQL